MKKRNKVILALIIFVLAIGGVAAFYASQPEPINIDELYARIEDNQTDSGRYYHMTKKTTTLSNYKHEQINEKFIDVTKDSHYRLEKTYEEWKDLGGSDSRWQNTANDGTLLFGIARAQGNYYKYIGQENNFEELVSGDLVLEEKLKSVVDKIEVSPWRDWPDENEKKAYLVAISESHSESIRRDLFRRIKKSNSDDLKFLGKMNWEGKEVYAFRMKYEVGGIVTIRYFDINDISYVGKEEARVKFNGDRKEPMLSYVKEVIISREYSNEDIGINGYGLPKESEGEIEEMLDQECEVDIDCIDDPKYRLTSECCVGGQCAVMNKLQETRASVHKYVPEKKIFIKYDVVDVWDREAQLVTNEDGRGKCEVSNPELKTIEQFWCVQDEDREIELLEEIK